MRSTEPNMRPPRTRTALRLACAAAALLALAEPGRAEQAAGEAALQATLERLGNFTYAGDPVMLRVAVFNTGKKPFENAAGIDLMRSLSIIDPDDGKKLAARPAAATDRRAEPALIPPGGFFGRIVDVREAVEGLDAPGRYTARLSIPGAEAQVTELVIIPRYEPWTAYRAVMETDYGTMSFDLFGKEAPRHVQNFFDLANQGWYDGTVVQAVVKGIEIHAGDRTGDGSSTPGYTLEPEISSDLKHRRGTLSMLRLGPNDHGSLFVISLAETKERDGVFSIFGSLAAGEETLAALENLPTSGTRETPPYRPLAQTRIRSLKVQAAPAESRATAASVPEAAAVAPR